MGQAGPNLYQATILMAQLSSILGQPNPMCTKINYFAFVINIAILLMLLTILSFLRIKEENSF